MPAINVAKTDTFESQRQKINQIGAAIFNISQGGSDLSTGNLKLGDGTRESPSLAFVSDSSLGIFKPTDKTFGFVSGSKKIADYSETAVYTFKDLIIQQNILNNSGVSVSNIGINYDAGSYNDVKLIGGVGDNATANITVTEFDGVINNVGSNYIEGTYEDISLDGGSSTGAIVSFDVPGIEGSIIDAGSGYIPGTYSDIDLTGGSGTGATANITIEGDVLINGSITSPGTGYTQGTYSSVQLITNPIQTFTVTSTGSPPTKLYSINGVSQQTLSVVKGNVYRFDLSDASNAASPITFKTSTGGTLDFANYSIVQKGVAGQAGGFVDLVVRPTAPTETILYDSLANPNGGGSINVVDGSIGSYGTNMSASILVNASGNITSVEITSSGNDYKEGDILGIYNGDIGGSGSGFQYTLITPTYTGEITQVNIQNNGQNYVNNNSLSVDSIDLGGEGSGFVYRITSNPGTIENLDFTSKSLGYSVNDTLTLPEQITNVQTNLKGQVSNISTTLSTSSAVITVSSTSGIIAGMGVTTDVINSTGSLSLGTTVLSVNGLTELTLSQNPLVSGNAILNFSSSGTLTEIQVPSTDNIIVGSFVTKTAGTGQLVANTTVFEIDSENNIITLSAQPAQAGTATLTFTPPFGVPANKFEYEILSLGSIESFDITSGGNGYSVSDVLTVNNLDLTQPTVIPVINKNLQSISFTTNIANSIFSVGDTITLVGGGLLSPIATIYQIKSSGGFIESMLVDSSNFTSGDIITGESISTSNYEIDVASETKYRYFIDAGSGYQLTPNLTLYVGNTYNFDLSDSSNSSHRFALSQFKDGIWSPSFIQNKTSTLSSSSNQITLNDVTGILTGMEVTVISGQGSLQLSTKVQSVNSLTNIVVLDKTPLQSGEAVLSFRGVEYLTSVTRNNNILSIKVIETTPNLYYYCSISNSSHSDEGGEDNQEAVLTINQNNPKIFGSNFSVLVSSLDTQDVIKGNVETGDFSAISFTGSEAILESAEITAILTAPTIDGNSITASSISSANNLVLSGTNVNVNGNFNIGSNVQIANSSGNITTSGFIKTTGILNVNDVLSIVNNTISTSNTNNIILFPPANRVVKIQGTTALTIPVGSSSERPLGNVVENGSIRFNTDTNQYEGYSSSSSSWSSLGGVRDLDGNTYIAAEASVGANDNTLYFYNDNNNTLKLNTNYLDFNTTKKLRSLNISLPSYTDWSSNTPVSLNSYLKYRNNIYLVTTAGITGSSGNEPVHTSGSQSNGTSVLEWFISAVAPLVFEEIEELRIGPTGNLPLVINSDLRLSNNIISTDVNDLLIRPNSGKKVTIDANTSLVLPVGDSNERGAPIQGSVRFNTSISQYEGYDGTNWSSLGGVRDVDGNTYIIPEISAGSNENILYFFNNNNNTLRVTENNIQLDTIDTIVSSTSNNLNLNAQLITFNNLSASIDTSGSSTFITTTQGNLDLGLASGLANDPLLRLSDTGDIYYNLGFGSGVYNGVKIFDSELKELEIADFKISTSKVTLTRNTVNTGSAILYDPALHESAKVQIIAHNTITGSKEFVEYSVIDDGTDIFFTDFGNVKTGSELISCVFDFNANNNVRVTFTLDTSVISGNTVEVTVISNIIKR